jgi:hypothetical protein
VYRLLLSCTGLQQSRHLAILGLLVVAALATRPGATAGLECWLLQAG